MLITFRFKFKIGLRLIPVSALNILSSDLIILIKCTYLLFFLQKLDSLTSLNKASAQWEKRIHKSLNSMCTDLETSLAKIRSQSEQEELFEKWNELSTYTSGNFT